MGKINIVAKMYKVQNGIKVHGSAINPCIYNFMSGESTLNLLSTPVYTTSCQVSQL